MKSLRKITPHDLNGTSYKGHAIYTTADQITNAIGMAPHVSENGVCEWYLKLENISFSLYCHSCNTRNETNWFRIGAISVLESIEVKDILTNALKTS